MILTLVVISILGGIAMLAMSHADDLVIFAVIGGIFIAIGWTVRRSETFSGRLWRALACFVASGLVMSFLATFDYHRGLGWRDYARNAVVFAGIGLLPALAVAFSTSRTVRPKGVDVTSGGLEEKAKG